MQQIEKNYFLSTLILCALIVFFKLICLYHVQVPLWVDEAQYWGWSKELALGYYSKPPFIAWLIGFTTHILGDTTFGVRAASPVLHFFTAIFVYFIARDIYNNNKIAFFSAVTYITLPAATISSSFISTDAPLMFFWAAALYALIHVTKFADKKLVLLWAFYAVCVGFGLLSKYTMAAFVLMSFYYILSTRKGKNMFRPDFWLANVLAFLIFVPNLYWNYNNHFVSFVHTGENVVTGGAGGGIHIGDMLEFLAGQLIVFGPALVFFVIAIVKKDFGGDKKLLLLFSLPLLAAGIIISLISGAQAHWAAPAYIAATILAIGHIIENDKKNWLKIVLITNVVIFVLCLNVKIPASIASIKKDPLARVTEWYKLAGPIHAATEFHPEALIVSDERKIIAPLMFALRDKDGNPKTIYKWNPKGLIQDHYDLTRRFTDTSNTTVIFASRFDRAEYLSSIYFNIDTILVPDETQSFYLYVLKGRR